MKRQWRISDFGLGNPAVGVIDLLHNVPEIISTVPRTLYTTITNADCLSNGKRTGIQVGRDVSYKCCFSSSKTVKDVSYQKDHCYPIKG